MDSNVVQVLVMTFINTILILILIAWCTRLEKRVYGKGEDSVGNVLEELSTKVLTLSRLLEWSTRYPTLNGLKVAFDEDFSELNYTIEKGTEGELFYFRTLDLYGVRILDTTNYSLILFNAILSCTPIQD